MATIPPNALRPEQSGVFTAPRALAALRKVARNAQAAWFDVDLHAVRDKAGFLQACARDLRFPSHFGANWDAFSDCLNDGSWVSSPGCVIVFNHVATAAQHAPDEISTAIEILRAAADAWRTRRRAFIVLLDAAPRALTVDGFPEAPRS